MIIQSIDIPNALRLDSQTVDSLMRGDVIAAIPRTFTNAGRNFALYPDQPDAETVTISAWARCEHCDIVDNSKPLDIISHYTAIPIQRLQEIIWHIKSPGMCHKIFLSNSTFHRQARHVRSLNHVHYLKCCSW